MGTHEREATVRTADEETYHARVDAARDALAADGLAGLVVFGLTNVRYLCGFSGSAGVLVVTRDDLVLLSDFRYRLQAAQEARVARFVEVDGRVSDVLAGHLGDAGGAVGIESTHLTVEEWSRLEPSLADIQHRFVKGVVERGRQVKSPGEVAAIAEAAALALTAYDRLREIAVVGRAERDIALELETWVRAQGSEPVPFPYIVAAGPRGAMPHAGVSQELIGRDQLVVVDLGATVDGYASDVTRTFATGPLGEEALVMHEVVVRAQAAGRAAAAPGVACAAVDAAARAVIDEAGMGDLFKHGLGHGVGLEVHEGPGVGARSEDVLAEGMVVTIEPGVYRPDVGGVRVEDTVVVTGSGIRVLTEYERAAMLLT